MITLKAVYSGLVEVDDNSGLVEVDDKGRVQWFSRSG